MSNKLESYALTHGTAPEALIFILKGSGKMGRIRPFSLFTCCDFACLIPHETQEG
jgi:hypothetical protein